jgi:hypothetical protein
LRIIAIVKVVPKLSVFALFPFVTERIKKIAEEQLGRESLG